MCFFIISIVPYDIRKSVDSMGDSQKRSQSKKEEGGTPRKRRRNSKQIEQDQSTQPRKYERKTSRFPWPDHLHRRFVCAIFEGIFE